MSNCAACGAEVSFSDRFCARCGAASSEARAICTELGASRWLERIGDAREVVA